jgi:TolB-like protein
VRARRLAAAVLLAAVPTGVSSLAAAQGKTVSIAVTDLAARGVDPVAAGALTTEVTNTLSAMGVFSVISGEDIKRLLTLEATKQACTGSGDAACLAEIGGALGVDYLVYGEVSKLADTFSISLTLLDTAKAAAVGRANRKVDQASRLLSETEGVARVLVRPLLEQNRGALVLEVGERGAKVKIDGRTLGVTPLSRRVELSMGPHEVSIDKAGFVPYARTVEVKPGAVTVETVTLVPNQAFISDYESTARTVRTVAWIGASGAAVALGAAGAMRLINDARFDDLVSKRYLESGLCVGVPGAQAGDLCPTPLGRSQGVVDDVASIEQLDRVALGLAIGGAVSGVVSVVLFLSGDEPGRYGAFSSRRAASASVAPLWLEDGAGLAVRGDF